MTRRLQLCISGHVDSRTGNTSPVIADLRHRCPADATDSSRSSLLASTAALRVPGHRLTAPGRLLSPTEAVHEGRRAMAPPNVTVVQGGLGPFGTHAPGPTSSMLSYLYQSGLAAHQPHAPGPFCARPLDAVAPPVPQSVSGEVPAFPFPAPAELTSAGIVAAAAAAAGLHLNPAALMLSAAGQLAAHPWLYPGYLAAAAALGQSAAVALNPAASSQSSPPSRHRHHVVSSSSRFAPYPGRSASGRSTPVERAPTGAATPPPAPDTTDSPPAEVGCASPATGPTSPGPTDDDAAETDQRGQLKNIEQMLNGLDHVMRTSTTRILTSSGGRTSNDDDVAAVSVDSSKT